MAAGSLALIGLITTWQTPIWLLALGATLGMLVLLICYGLLWVISRPAARLVPAIVSEGILQPIFYLVLLLAGLALLLAFQMPVRSVFQSLARLPSVMPVHKQVIVPANHRDFPIAVPPFRGEELRRYTLKSNQDVVVVAQPDMSEAEQAVRVFAGEPEIWTEVSGRVQPFSGRVATLYVTNESDLPATLSIDMIVAVVDPEVVVIPITALVLIVLVLVYFGLWVFLPKVSAVAAITAKEAMSQPVYYFALIVGGVALIIFIYIPYNTFGEDVKMLKDSGLTLIMVLAIFVALWTASVSVSEEIEGRTALTVLSKPVRRREFILGKFLGIIWPVLLLFVLLGLLFLVTISYKVVYDARETSSGDVTWQQCYATMIGTVPGMALALMEVVVLASISVAISTRLSMLPNLIICASIYVLGHLGPLIVNSAVGRFQIVEFAGRLIAAVFPVLDHFNIQAAVAGGVVVPLSYLGWALLYCALYSTIAMLVALVLFEDRDLA